MSYDEKLAHRIRRAVGPTEVDERKMFGGLAFLRGGKMFCGINGQDLMLRVGPAAYEGALRKPHVRVMDFTGRPLTGYVYVGPGGMRTQAALRAWVKLASSFVAGLPPAKRRKAKRPRRAARRRR